MKYSFTVATDHLDELRLILDFLGVPSPAKPPSKTDVMKAIESVTVVEVEAPFSGETEVIEALDLRADVRAAATRLVQTEGGKAKLSAIFKSAGFASLSELSDASLPVVLAKIEEALS